VRNIEKEDFKEHLEAIFSQSPVNEGYYNEQQMPQNHWDWPRKTWFQSRRDFIRDNEQGGLRPAEAQRARQPAIDVARGWVRCDTLSPAEHP